ncbi:hypothetical protein CSW21_07245 [Thermus scotoductus]|nr:hypothetical protein CSW21_07245 [Thermus scotoductus]
MSFTAYLEMEEGSPVRHGLMGGFPHAMAGTSKTHNLRRIFWCAPGSRAWSFPVGGKEASGGRRYAVGRVVLPCPEAALDLEAPYEGVELESA